MAEENFRMRAFNFDTGKMFQVEEIEMAGWARGHDRQHKYQDVFFKKYGENPANGCLLRPTGYFDVNDNEIYEDDIVESLRPGSYGERFKVSYGNGFYLNNGKGADEDIEESQQFRIVGNIYEGVKGNANKF